VGYLSVQLYWTQQAMEDFGLAKPTTLSVDSDLSESVLIAGRKNPVCPI